jgi:hypothetical protein
MDIIQKKREILIQSIKNMPNNDIEKVFKLVTDYQKSLIPYDDEPLNEKEKKAIEEFESGKMEFVSWDEVFRDEDNEK